MLGKQDIQKLNQYQRKILKSIMHLPERTANAGVYVLAGQLPIEADIDKKYLTHLINFLRSEGVEKELAWRQLEVKNTKSRSWFLYVAKILTKHNLQSIYDLLEHTVPKLKWRKTVKSVVKEHWKSEIKKKGVQKSSMRFMNLEDPRVGQPHQIWECASIDTLQVKKAGVRANLLAETYKLQLTVSNFQGGGGGELTLHDVLLRRRKSATLYFRMQLTLRHMWTIYTVAFQNPGRAWAILFLQDQQIVLTSAYTGPDTSNIANTPTETKDTTQNRSSE